MSVEENEKNIVRRLPRRRRAVYIVGLFLCLLVFLAIGIVAGYFIGKSSGTCKPHGASTEELQGDGRKVAAIVHEAAVSEVSTQQLKDYLK